VVARDVQTNRKARQRLEAMLACMDSPPVELVDPCELERLLAAMPQRQELRRGGLEGRARKKELAAFSLLRESENVFPGYSWQELRSAGVQRREHEVICQTGVELQSAVGCPFDCTYCPYVSFICARLDVETFVDRVTRLVRARPAQRLYKLNNRTDTLGLEPAYDLAAPLIRRFAELDEGYLLLYAKGDAVDHLLDLEHGGHTAASFTITPEAVARLLETGAPPPARRIEALGKMYRAGYPVRVRLSPILPLRGWEQAYQALVSEIFAAGKPEMITLWTLSMVELDDLARIVPPELLDEGALQEARAAGARLRGRKGAPFPEAVRAHLYRTIAGQIRAASPDTRLALCLESPEVWRLVGDAVGPLQGRSFHCNCGPLSVPGCVR